MTTQAAHDIVNRIAYCKAVYNNQPVEVLEENGDTALVTGFFAGNIPNAETVHCQRVALAELTEKELVLE